MGNYDLYYLLKTDIEYTPLLKGQVETLRSYGYECLGDLVQIDKKDIIRFKGFGLSTLRLLERYLLSKGLSFGMDVKSIDRPNSAPIVDAVTRKESQIDIIDLLDRGVSINLTINLSDLVKFADHLIHHTKEELESSILAKRQETYLKPKEVSKQLDVDISTLWRWAKDGYLVPIELGGKRLYKQSDIDAILKRNGE